MAAPPAIDMCSVSLVGLKDYRTVWKVLLCDEHLEWGLLAVGQWKCGKYVYSVHLMWFCVLVQRNDLRVPGAVHLCLNWKEAYRVMNVY